MNMMNKIIISQKRIKIQFSLTKYGHIKEMYITLSRINANYVTPR